MIRQISDRNSETRRNVNITHSRHPPFGERRLNMLAQRDATAVFFAYHRRLNPDIINELNVQENCTNRGQYTQLEGF